MDVVLSQTRELLFQLGFLPIILFATLVSVYVYWREARFTHKNKNSIFDGYLFSLIIAVIWGRVSYILTKPIDYDGLIWSLIPYERYPDGFYLFRLLPWRYFRVWDGEFLFTGLFVGFIFAATLFCLAYKRWRWREVFPAVISGGAVYLGVLLSIFGFLIGSSVVLTQGGVILGVCLVYFILARTLGKALHDSLTRLWERLNYLLIFFFTSIICLYVPSALLSSEITDWDRYNMYAFVIFAVLAHLIFIVDVFRKEVKIKTEYRTRSVSISANQPVKI
ncbi:hypothetical protein IT417_02930 [bacterium]|nr:hypothetical protein [bacterium]